MTAILMDIPADAIDLRAANVRTDGDCDLAGLTASLTYGYAQRPTLVATGNGRYDVLTGERRVRAALAAGWTNIPALIDDAPDPISAHTRRLLENLHRRDLNPLDEARALKLGWLCANTVAIGQTDAAHIALRDASSPADALAAIQSLLDATEWTAHAPTITQETYLANLGLGLSKAALRKKLQVLALSADAQAALAGLPLTAAAIRAMLQLDPLDQAMLLDAIQADGDLAKQVRSIVQGVRVKGRSITDALAIAQGRVPGMDTPAPTSPDSHATDAASAAQAISAQDAPITPATGGLDEQAAADVVLPLYESAQTLASQLHTLHTACGVGGITALPDPWNVFTEEALTTIRTALHAIEHPEDVHVL